MQADRTFSDVFEDIVRNMQEIVRSEVRLAKTEIREEAGKAKSSVAMLGAGAVIALFAVFFLLLTVVYALALVIPGWAASLIVGAALSMAAALALMAGKTRLRQIHVTPERTLETLKENVEWTRQQIK